MANLLQKASIVLTPTAYDDGKVLCAKPSEAPYGDFDFSRNSAATRVNAQGLVENVQILSSNLVQNGSFSEEGAEEVSNGSFSQQGSEQITNGDFSNGTTGWSSNATLTESNNIANITTTSPSVVYIRQNNVYEFGKSYKLTFTAKVDNLTEFQLYVGSTRGYIDTGIIPTQTTDFQEYNFYFQADTAGGMNLLLRQSMVANSSIEYSEISVVEVGQNWNLGAGFSIGENKLIGINANSSTYQGVGIQANKTYKIQFTILDYVSGNVKPLLNGAPNVDGTNVSGNGTYTQYLTSTTNSNGNFSVRGENNFNGSITNISVKEVGQNWNFDANWSIGENKAISDATGGFIKQTNVGGAGVTATYKVQWTQNITTGTRLRFFARNYNDGGNATTLSITRDDGTSMSGGNCVGSGTFTAYVSSTNGYSFKILAETGVEADITNITTIQITDDTNLPRISYENFSYQDALGSEEIVNGGFDNGSANWTLGSSWSVSNGLAYTDGTAQNFISQNIGLVTGKTYNLSFDISNRVGADGCIVIFGGTTFSGNAFANGTQTFQATANGGIELRIYGFNGNTYNLDNVSVKEYLGQEVVPNSGCGSWLFEPQTTQLLPYSEDFSQWIAAATPTIESGYLAPDGSNNAYKVGGTGLLYVTLGAGVLDNATRSIYARTVSGTGQAHLCSFNGNSNNLFTITEQWQRFEVNSAIPTGGTSFYAVDFRGSTNLSEIIIWGANATNDQDYATSYIPSNGSTVTRNQDVCTNGGSLATINSTEGTLYAEIAALTKDSSYKLISLKAIDFNNRIEIGIGTNNKIHVYLVSNSATLIGSTSQDFTIDEVFKVALKWSNTNGCTLYINGSQITTAGNSTFSALDFNALDFNNFYGNPFFGKTKALAVWKEALSDQELADLTYPTPTDPTFTLDFDTIAEQFTFARGSEATYVDAQGLIQSTNELGEELITNGDFATDTGWAKQAGWTISGGTANANMILGGNGNIYQSALVSGKTYELTFTVSNYVQGNIRNVSQASNLWTEYNSNGTFTEIFVANTANLFMNANVGASTQLSIDNVSVKEVISATNTPRLDYSTGAEAFLLEPQSTNLIPYSEDFSVSNWAKGNSSIISNTALSPSGIVNASKLVENTNLSSHTIFFNSPNTPVISGQKYTMSFFAKEDGRNIRISNAAESSMNVQYNLLTGTIILSGGAEDSSSIVNYGNGWYRCTMSFTASATIAQFNLALIDENNAVTYQGDGTSGVNIWGAQIEAQSFATSYIPSNGSQTTRNQETCINATPETNSEEGTLYIEGSALVGGSNRQISLSDGTNDNGVKLRLDLNPDRLTGFLRGNAGTFSIKTITGVTQTDNNKIALVWNATNLRIWLNGVEAGTIATNDLPIGLNTLNFANNTGTSNFYGNTKNLQVYPKALSDAELIKLTT